MTPGNLSSVGLRKRIAVINDHDHTNSHDLTELPRREHRDANTAVAGGSSGDRRVAVNGDTVIDVIRVVEQSQRTFSPTFDLVIDLEPARWRFGLPRHAAFGKSLAGAR